VAKAFGGHVSLVAEAESDCAIFVINPSTGIDQITIDIWRAIDELQTPRIVVVTQLENQEADFDDAVMLANRVFDHMATPFLVLHDDAGLPCALISLETMRIVDYSTNPPADIACEPEHELLVQEFRDEYLELSTSLGSSAFAAGMLFPAIPLWIEKGVGVDIVNNYLSELHN
jgi:translation elongation factor EF-G